ncbi:MAG: hypothetical protein F6K31_21330 [Symploca sp. SIO2G7]|nr:hypothetical protein [Symploca sp. SIO2G7]
MPAALEIQNKFVDYCLTFLATVKTLIAVLVSQFSDPIPYSPFPKTNNESTLS